MALERRQWAVVAAALLLLGGCGSSSTDGPPSPAPAEFRATDSTVSERPIALIAADNGDLVVVWRTPEPLLPNAGPEALLARRFDAAGQRVGPEIVVRQQAPDHIGQVEARPDPAGGFLVVWEDGEGTFVTRYDPSGSSLTGAVPLDERGLGGVLMTSASAEFVIVREAGDPLNPHHWDLYGRRYSGSGTPLGAPFPVNAASATGQSGEPSLAPRAGGGFFVVWSQFPEASLRGQLFAGDGQKVGAELTLSTDPGLNEAPKVIAQAGGSFVVGWSNSADASRSHYRVMFRRFDASGAALGPSAIAHDALVVGQPLPLNAAQTFDIAGRSDFVVAWTERTNGGPLVPQARRFSAAGEPVGNVFALPIATPSDQFGPLLAVDAAGNLVAAWTRTEPGSLSGRIWLRRFGRGGTGAVPPLPASN